MKINKNRLYRDFYLEDWGVNKIDGVYQFACNPCDLCDLTKECDRLSDDLNDIYYCMCLSKGVIQDTNYKKEHPDSYFKKLKFN